MNVLLKLRERLLDVFFPKVCGYCGEAFRHGLSNVLCVSCFERIQPFEAPTCELCGISLPERAFEGVDQLRCLDCDERPSHLDQVWALGAYEGPLRSAHHSFKFEGMEHLAIPLSRKILDRFLAPFWQGIQGLVPVPMSPEKERERGYNPADLLAQQFSNQLKIPVLSTLQKVRPTISQRFLTREERLKNQKGSFDAKVLSGQTKVILVDDVLTTGATLEECAKVLRKAGAQWVGAIVWGRTPRHGSDRAGN